MFKMKFDPTKKEPIIKPEDLLPKTVENTRGELVAFTPQKLIDSLMTETGLDKKRAVDVTTNVLRRISSLGMQFVAAPHLRELVCGELTAQKLHKYRNQYTRLGMPIYDVKKTLESQQKPSGEYSPLFSYLWITSQVVEQYVHLDQLTDAASSIIDAITKDAEKLPPEEKAIILGGLHNAITLYHEKKEGKKQGAGAQAVADLNGK
jgi:hypothetical protein